MHVNLLPSSFVWQRLLRKRLRQWACALAGLPIVFIAANVPFVIQWWVDLHEYQAMRMAADPARKLQDTRIEIAKATLELKQKIEYLQALTARDRDASILGLIAKSVDAANKTIQIQQLQMNIETKSLEIQSTNPTLASTPNTLRPNLRTASNVLENQVRLTLKGIAVESESISIFVDTIQRSNVFPKVELRSTQERVLLDRSIQDFELECFGNE